MVRNCAISSLVVKGVTVSRAVRYKLYNSKIRFYIDWPGHLVVCLCRGSIPGRRGVG